MKRRDLGNANAQVTKLFTTSIIEYLVGFVMAKSYK